MTRNVGTFDRSLRVLVGFLLLAAYFGWPDLSYGWVLLIGIVPLVTGLFGTCAIYSLLGIKTCRT